MTSRASQLNAADLRGIARLAAHATVGVADVAEALHAAIVRPFGLSGGRAAPDRTRGVTGLIYRTVRGVSRGVGGGVDALLGTLVPAHDAQRRPASRRREAMVAALNGVLGDHLAATGNPLAIPMSLRSAGRTLQLDARSLQTALPQAGGRLLVLVHGLCMNDLQWSRGGHDHGAVLARELGCTPVYLHYNTGLHTSTNGRAFADLLETLVAQWPHPVDEVAIVAHSMGGLVARSACHHAAAAGHAWPRRLRTLVFLGTPHHGAPLERGGNGIDALLAATPWSAPFARLGRVRSAGITDLRHGNVIDEHWQGRDRFAPVRAESRRSVPLPAGVRCFAVAASTAERPHRLRDRLVGDGLVPVDSALGRHRDPAHTLAFPKSHLWVGYRMGHLELLGSEAVAARLVRWLR